MRKFSAHRIYPVSSPPIPFGIIETEDDGTVIRIRETGGRPVEESGLEFYNGILIPGFVNAHCHLELSHLKGRIPERTGMAGFIRSVALERDDESEDRIQSAIRSADSEMHAEGIVAVGDISNRADTLPVKQTSPIRYHTFVELFGLNPDIAEARYTQALQTLSIFRLSPFSLRLPASLSPHSLYSLSGTLWSLLASASAESLSRVSIHYHESPEEMELLASSTGPLADYFREIGLDPAGIPANVLDVGNLLNQYLPGSEILLVHNTMDPHPALSLPSAVGRPLSAVRYVLCPRSNLFIHNRLPAFRAFADSAVSVCLGTDSLASNWRLSILEEIRAVQDSDPGIPFETLLEWATLNGATALGMGHDLGSLDPGKKPGLLNISKIDLDNERILAQSRVRRLI